jgi:dipeptidase D
MWEIFAAISAIPRASGHEGPVRDYLKSRAASRGWEIREDAVGNVVFRVPGAGALGDAEALILQGHMDMVCEKEVDGTHDFGRDPLRLRCDGEWVDAEGTTLGADNGIAIAMATAAAEAPAEHRLPLELLWTVDEETGLTGAMGLDAGMLRGRRMINLDSESEGVFIIGCAGGLDLAVRFEGREGDVPPGAVTCRLTGFRGGHSGINIHEGRGNAVRAAAGLLQELRTAFPDAVLLGFDGGTKKNAIPRDAEFTVAGPTRAEVAERLAGKMKECTAAEPSAALETGPAEVPPGIVLPWAAVDFVTSIPNGVIAIDPDLEGMVRTSSNIGVAATGDGGVGFRFHVRSSVDAERDEAGRRIAAIAGELGGTGTPGAAYPGWEPRPHSSLLRMLERTWRRLNGSEPKVTAIHAGLEAGVIGALLGSDEMASFGPTIENAHSPSERLHVASAERTCRFLREVITAV